TGSSLFSDKQTFELQKDKTEVFAGRTLALADLREVRHENYAAVEATVTLTSATGEVQTFKPQRRFYDKAEEPSSEVAIQSSLKRDSHRTRAGWEEGGKKVAIQAIITPLVSWIWIGGIVLTAGGIICLLPRLIRHAESVQPSLATSPPVQIRTAKKTQKT